jgi:hypothetical protein
VVPGKLLAMPIAVVNPATGAAEDEFTNLKTIWKG